MKRTTGIFLSLFILSMFSCEEILFEKDISTAQLEILAPRNNSLIKASTIFFSWTKVEGATTYEVQLATPNFESAQQIIFNSIVEEISYSDDLLPGDYEWRVRAVNSGYSTAFASALFTVESNEAFSSNRLVLLTPQDNYITNSANITLEWQEVDQATAYRIQVVENSLVKIEETTEDTSFDMEFPEGEFIWKVRAENETQNTFYTGRNILVDRTSPNTPTLTRPVDKSTTNDPSLTFEWDRTAISGSVEIDSLFIFKDAGLKDLVKKERVANSYTTLLERQNTYYWFMKSYDMAGNESEESEVFSFTITN